MTAAGGEHVSLQTLRGHHQLQRHVPPPSPALLPWWAHVVFVWLPWGPCITACRLLSSCFCTIICMPAVRRCLRNIREPPCGTAFLWKHASFVPVAFFFSNAWKNTKTAEQRFSLSHCDFAWFIFISFAFRMVGGGGGKMTSNECVSFATIMFLFLFCFWAQSSQTGRQGCQMPPTDTQNNMQACALWDNGAMCLLDSL